MKTMKQTILFLLLSVGLFSSSYGADVKIDQSTPLAVLKAEAEKDNPDAQCWLAICYEYGLQDSNIDQPKAKELFSKAAKHADEKLATVQHAKAVCYANGYGIAKTKDLEKAVEWYRKAVEQDFAPSQYSLGVCYYDGKGISKKNYTEAVKCFKKASKQDYLPAHFYLSCCYGNGYGVAVNPDLAETLLLKAVNRGLPQAQYLRGMQFLKMESIARSREMVQLFRKAAERGHDGGQCQLGTCYYLGIGGLQKNTAEAGKWLHKAAEQGNSEAKKRLAQFGLLR